MLPPRVAPGWRNPGLYDATSLRLEQDDTPLHEGFFSFPFAPFAGLPFGCGSAALCLGDFVRVLI